MIPWRMLNHGSPSKNLHASGYFPPVTQGHFEQNYARLQRYRRAQDLNLNIARSERERLQRHYETMRPMLHPKRPVPSVDEV